MDSLKRIAAKSLSALYHRLEVLLVCLPPHSRQLDLSPLLLARADTGDSRLPGLPNVQLNVFRSELGAAVEFFERAVARASAGERVRGEGVREGEEGGLEVRVLW